ncbi:MAG: hypothetical protein LBT48_08685 [Prevotellaceae bacterium]|jgi:uncharacterized protein (TIGR02145 family)|nr:hypothetical protein [Prevotellaceae bacterium]
MKRKTFMTYAASLLAGVALVVACNDDPTAENPTLDVTPTSFNPSANSNVLYLAVSSNTAWTAVVEDASSHQWCVITYGASGNKNDVILLSVSQNTADNDRDAVVIVSAGSLIRRVNIRQDAPVKPAVKLSLKPSNGVLEFTTTSGAGTITINCNTTWTITGGENASWVTLEPKSGAETVTVNVAVEELPEEADDRTAVYTVTAGTATKTITINQTAVHELGRVVGGVIWATRNVGVPGKFAKTMDDPGKVYKFNTKLYYDPPKDLSNNAEAAPADWDDSYPGPGDWTKANDPCPTGWHVPTLSEWTGSLLACTSVPDGRLLGTSMEELNAGDKTSEWLVYLPFVQQWASTYNGTYPEAGERTSESGYAARYWTARQFEGQVPEDPTNACKVDYSKAIEYMAHYILMYTGGGTIWGDHWTYSTLSEAGEREDESWNENLNKGNAYAVRCVRD